MYLGTLNEQIDDLLARICAKLQITATQHGDAEDRYIAIGNWLGADGSLVAAYRPTIYPQGSLRLGTTVKPLASQEYDLDLVCELSADPRSFPNPVTLLDMIEARLREHGTYKMMLERKNRCVRVVYADEFHLDILPACPDTSSGATCVLVPDRKARCWKHSNPKGYAKWFENIADRAPADSRKHVEPLPDQVVSSQMVPLKLAVQLMKRWRDIAYADKPEVAPISIVLTTLAAHHYGNQTSVNETLSAILDRIIVSLPPVGRLKVCNPSNPNEDLSERWDSCPNAYEAFVDGMITFSHQWRQLNEQRGIGQVATFLQQMFGENIAKSVIVEQAKSLEAARAAGELATSGTSGAITSVGGAGTTPIRHNTFYGD